LIFIFFPIYVSKYLVFPLVNSLYAINRSNNISLLCFQEDFDVRLQVWDTAGQERFRCLIHSYIRDSEAALIVFDVTNHTSFTSLRQWIAMVKQERGDDVIVVLIGNKVDDVEKRQVSRTSGARMRGFRF